jgi:hypothetical protein
MTSTQLVAGQPAVRYKILMYHAGDGHWLYPAVLHLKTYIDVVCPEICNQIDWLLPIQHTMTDDELVAHIDEYQPDVLCTSHYIWNHDGLITQLSNIKNKINKDIKIIAGGPSINVNLDPNFFKKYPAIDFAVYGPGEQAFADIIKSQIDGIPLKAFNTSNCGWVNPITGQPTVAQYKFVKMISTSPFTTNQELFSMMVASLGCQVDDLIFPYMLTRGCPYTCTFCDWNSGLGTKVSRRKNTYQQEIDLFQQLGIKKIFLADANVGQYDEDVDMIEYFAEKNVKENTRFTLSGNYSKLRKDVNLKIFDIMAKSNLTERALNLSIQDTNKQVLENINRPDVGWEEHLKIANKLQHDYPKLLVTAQLIYGLPGQTPDTWRQTLKQITENNIQPIVFLNEPLPASPAMYDPEYQKQFQFEYVTSTRSTFDNNFFVSQLPKQCISFDQLDLVSMTLLSSFYYVVTTLKICATKFVEFDMNIESVINSLLNSKYYKDWYQNLYDNWTTEQKFYFTKDFFGNPCVLSADPLIVGSKLACNNKFNAYLLEILPLDKSNKILKLLVDPDFKKFVNEVYSQIN